MTINLLWTAIRMTESWVNMKRHRDTKYLLWYINEVSKDHQVINEEFLLTLYAVKSYLDTLSNKYRVSHYYLNIVYEIAYVISIVTEELRAHKESENLLNTLELIY